MRETKKTVIKIMGMTETIHWKIWYTLIIRRYHISTCKVGPL